MSPVLPSPPPEPASPAPATAGIPVPRALGFNCPACGVVLTIPDPGTYDGRPAPCPQCAVLVMPPRIFHAGNEVEPIDLHPLPGLSGRGGSQIKMPRAIHRPLRHCAARADDGDLWIGGRPEGVVLSSRA